MRRRDFVAAMLSSGCLPAALAGETAGALRIATFDVDVTPPLGTPLCHGNVRPDDSVRMAAYGDAGTTYIGTKIAYSQGGYEVTRSRVSPRVEDVLLPAIRRLLSDE